MNTSALMQVQVNGNPDEIVSITDFDFSQIFEDLEDENIEDLVVLTLFMDYFESMSINHSNLPNTDINPNFTPMMFGLVKDYSTTDGHSEDSASLVCFNKRMVKELFASELQMGEEALELPFEEFLELARPHLPPSLEVIQNPITLRVVRATLAPPIPPLMPTALMDSSPSNYIDVFDIVKEKISNREVILEGSHTVAKYYPDGDYIEFVAECGLYFGMEETGNFQIEVDSDGSSNSNANFSIELSGIKEGFSINLGNQKLFDMFTPNLDDVDYFFSSEQDESGDYRAYLSIRNLSGRRLGINIDTDADILLIESGWTPDEEDSGREIIVNEIPYGISNIQFKTGNTYLEVPSYLPDTITSLDSTFEGCRDFNSYISDWDTSRVRSMRNTFYSCKNFDQDISRWDVSNVTDMGYAFIGASSFNSDLSIWNVGKVENFDYTFSDARSFDSDLSQWDTSSATSMFRMFSSALNFSSIVEDWDVRNVENMDYMFQPTSGETTSLPPQDLSRWCVTKVPFQPMEFIDYDWAGTLPIWGTCPSGDGSGDDGGSNTPEINFLKVISEIIRVVPNNNAGIAYKINNEPIRASLFQNAEHAHATEAVTASAMFQSDELATSYIAYQTDLLGHGTPVAPAPLDPDASYILGLNDTLLSSFFSGEMSLPEGFEGIEGEVVVTLYPASYLPSVNIDQDLFDYIIDPASYTQADLQYFSERGVTPATKNPDGSYTLKSQLTLPMP